MTVNRTILTVAALASLTGPVHTFAVDNAEVRSADEHTIALWLFDDTSYPSAILTDAGPYRHDLRLLCGYAKWWSRTGGKGNPDEEPLHRKGSGGLVKGKFGNALQLPAGDSGEVKWPDHRQRYGSAFLFDRGNEVPERLNLGYFDWTLEVWFKASGDQESRASLLEWRNEVERRDEDHPTAIPMVNALMLDAKRERFTLLSQVLKDDPKRRFHLELAIPTAAAKLNDKEWHHLAFTYRAEERQLRHYVDGRLQQLPEKGGVLPMMGPLVWLSIDNQLHCLLDEMRISDVVRYTGDFTPPGSFSRHYGTDAPESNQADGPPLLFGPDQKGEGVVPLGSRKHLFIDNVLIAQQSDVRFTLNPPVSRQVTGFRNDKPWEPTPRFGSSIPDVCSVWDEGDEIRMLYANGGLWGGKPHAICFATAKDGLNWNKPVLHLQSWDGSTQNNIVLRDACQGSVIKDPNPCVSPDARYKYVAWAMYWGFYVFTSPDGIHWRRNETCALPFDPDGSIDCYWDDQRGIYQAYIRAMFYEGVKRQIARVHVPEILKPWQFKPADRPDMGDMVLARPISDELPLIDTGGQVYRFKAHKYPWAPDVYLAFPWRYIAGKNIRPGSFLMVSRDGEHWKRYEDPGYFSSGWKLDGREVLEALMEQGMIRRGDEIWQYGTVRFTEHGGILYGGVEHEAGVYDRLLRLVQRLDGFVSLDAGEKVGTILTRPLIFAGVKLELNISAQEKARIALVDETGQPFEGFGLESCDPILGDRIRQTVTWRGKPDVSLLAGKPVRLRFELQKTKLFAFQFVERD